MTQQQVGEPALARWCRWHGSALVEALCCGDGPADTQRDWRAQALVTRLHGRPSIGLKMYPDLGRARWRVTAADRCEGFLAAFQDPKREEPDALVWSGARSAFPAGRYRNLRLQ